MSQAYYYQTITLISLLALALSACATLPHPSALPPSRNAQPAATSEPAADPEQTGILHFQDRLNFFASPRYLAHVQAAKDAGADALQVACMDSTVEIGADVKARPLLVLPSVKLPSLDLGAIDPNCGWCVLAAKRKADAERTNGPSILEQLANVHAQIADARKRVAGLARKGLVACAPLKEDMRLSLLNPENAAAGLFELLNLFDGGN